MLIILEFLLWARYQGCHFHATAVDSLLFWNRNLPKSYKLAGLGEETQDTRHTWGRMPWSSGTTVCEHFACQKGTVERVYCIGQDKPLVNHIGFLLLLFFSFLLFLPSLLSLFCSYLQYSVPLWHAGSLAAACELLVATCGIQFPDQGSNPSPALGKWGSSHWTTREVLGLVFLQNTRKMPRGHHCSIKRPRMFLKATLNPCAYLAAGQ